MEPFKWPGNYDLNCPICHLKLTFNLDIDTEPETYIHEEDIILAANGVCPFCNTSIAVTFDYKGKAELRDVKWDTEKKKYYDRLSEIVDTIEEIKIELDEDDVTDIRRTALERRFGILKVREQKLEDDFSLKEDKHQDRKDRMNERAYNKYKDDAF